MRDPVTLYQSVEALDMHIYYPKGYSMQSLLVRYHNISNNGRHTKHLLPYANTEIFVYTKKGIQLN